jgi:hypothetical protein
MRKGFIIVVLAITFATVGFASRNTTTGQTVADRFEKYKEVAKEKAKEKGREFFDREKKAKDAAKDAAHEVVNKVIDHFIPGGDNRPAKAVGDAAFNKDPWYKAFFRVFLTPSEIGQEPTFTDPQQTVTDKPVVPAGPFDGTPTEYVKPQPVVPANPSNQNASSPRAAQQNGHESGGIFGSQHEGNTNSQPSAPAGNEASASNNASTNQGNSKTIMLEAGKTTWAQADPNKVVTVNSPETTSSGGSSSSQAAPAQSAPAPAATPSPAPVHEAAPAPSPAPATAPAPIQHEHGGVGPSGHEGGGHQGGGWAGPDAHGGGVEAAGHIS